MEFLETLLPNFGEAWIAQCMAAVAAIGGIPPHIATPVHPGQTTYAFRATVADQENQSAMDEYLQIMAAT